MKLFFVVKNEVHKDNERLQMLTCPMFLSHHLYIVNKPSSFTNCTLIKRIKIKDVLVLIILEVLQTEINNIF